MPSSVTVDDALRRKIKKLAAELDTTQGEIVSRAIELFEKTLSAESYSPDPEARRLISEAAKRRQDIPWRKKVREALRKPGPHIEDLRISRWSEVVENKP